jgi:hypothetical protein
MRGNIAPALNLKGVHLTAWEQKLPRGERSPTDIGHFSMFDICTYNPLPDQLSPGVESRFGEPVYSL